MMYGFYQAMMIVNFSGKKLKFSLDEIISYRSMNNILNEISLK